jgi:hypothetical protein
LRVERGITFEEIQGAIERGDLVDIVKHHNQSRYEKQRMLLVKLSNYIYLVPFVEDDFSYFLKTIIPSRKATREYLGAKDE